MPSWEKLQDFVAWCGKHISGDEKGQAQIFRDWRLQAFNVSACAKSPATL
ncbi:MAG: hypothetical protein V9H26_07435 [Verrucomicrobiota bacterium]|nr:hypothetical protein [Verrucomicrobiota bacterium]MCC6822383.1 hypothetical protein [Limisphaerales bacterium]